MENLDYYPKVLYFEHILDKNAPHGLSFQRPEGIPPVQKIIADNGNFVLAGK